MSVMTKVVWIHESLAWDIRGPNPSCLGVGLVGEQGWTTVDERLHCLFPSLSRAWIHASSWALSPRFVALLQHRVVSPPTSTGSNTYLPLSCSANISLGLSRTLSCSSTSSRHPSEGAQEHYHGTTVGCANIAPILWDSNVIQLLVPGG
jgi:hypothetical protein